MRFLRLLPIVLTALALFPQLIDSIEAGRSFALAVDYVNDPTRPATEIVLFQNGTQVTTATPPTNGTVQFQYPNGLSSGLYNFRIIARNAAGPSPEPNPTVALTVTVAPPPPPPPPQGTPIEFESRSCEWVMKTLSSPDGTTGWSIQFRERLANGTFTNLSYPDVTVPYRRAADLSAGSHVISAVWTKSGKTPVVLPSVTRVCQ